LAGDLSNLVIDGCIQSDMNHGNMGTMHVDDFV